MPVCAACGTRYGSTVRICVHDGTPLVTGRIHDQHLGTLLDGKYRIDSFITAGGMGSVYRAVHVLLDKTVAVKVIKTNSSHRTKSSPGSSGKRAPRPI